MRVLSWSAWPGLLAAIAVAVLAQPLAMLLGRVVLAVQGLDPTGSGPVSPIAVAVVLGAIVANTVPVPTGLAPGLTLVVNRALRLGIILIGLKLSLLDVLTVGGLGVPVVFTLVAFAMVVTIAIARFAGVPSTLGILAAASTAICGITATLAVAPVIQADEREVAYTVANVTILGLFGMLVYPYLAHVLFADEPGAAGLFLGTAIHDTSQVMGAAQSYQELFGDSRAVEIATVVKLTRNTLLIAVVPLLGWFHRRSSGGGRRPAVGSLFPLFVLGFLALSAVRTVGDIGLGSGGLALGLLDASSWSALIGWLGGTVASFALAAALAAVGLQTRLSVLRGLGPRPFLVGVAAAVTVGVASVLLASLVGPLIGSGT